MTRTATITASIFLLVFLSRCPSLKAETKATLNSFFIAAHVFSDAAPNWFEYVLDVEPFESGSRVRHIRIAPVSEFCPDNVTIRGMEKRLKSTPERISSADLCLMKETDFKRYISRVSKNSLIDDTVGYTVVATCDGVQRVFDVPYLETLDLKKLRRLSPTAARIVELYAIVEKRVFPKEPINGMSHPKDLQLQIDAEPFLSDLRSGRFDAAFASGLLRQILSRYHGVIRTATQPIPKLSGFDVSTLSSYALPAYPSLALMARVETQVELELSIDRESGRVTSVKIIHGHPLFEGDSFSAAEKWRFDPTKISGDSVHAVFNYSLKCGIP